MAIVKCRTCGKEITDIYDNCPYCNNPVNKLNSEKADRSTVTSDDLNENLILAGFGSFFALVGLQFFSSLMSIQGAHALGDIALASIATANSTTSLFTIIMLFVGAIAFTFIPLLVNKFYSLPEFILTPVISVVLAVISGVIISIFKMQLLSIYAVSPEVLELSSQIILYYSVAAPLLQGAIITAGKSHTPLFGILFEMMPVVVFLLSGLLLITLLVFVFALGITGLVIAGLVSLILTLIVSVVKSIFIKDF